MKNNPILISGIQSTGRLHIGNYLGMLKQSVELQNSGKYECLYFIADLHSLTEGLSSEEVKKNIYEASADALAAGLDPKKSVIFQQSQIPAHSELAWILNTITPIGELERMTQYKDKSASQKENVNVGLLDYPVLMAADILLYDTQFVPVGDDQDQHLELARTLARRFNNRFGKTFVEPKGVHTPTPRVMSLTDPRKKMSKSDPASCLFMDDAPADVETKIKRAVTDSGAEVKYDKAKKPGISNLLEICASLSGEAIPALEKKYKGKTYSAFKADLAQVISDHFADFRKKKTALVKDPQKLESVLEAGSKKAAKAADKKMALVKRKVGLL